MSGPSTTNHNHDSHTAMTLSASERTMAIAELVDIIAGHVPSEDLIAASQVCRSLYVNLHGDPVSRKRLLRALQMRNTRKHWKQVPFIDRYTKSPNPFPSKPPGVEVELFTPPEESLTSLQWIWGRLRRARDPSPPLFITATPHCTNAYCAGGCMLCGQ